MVLSASVKVVMGSPLPSFSLSDPYHKEHTSKDLLGPKGLMVIFISNSCPYALAAWPRLIRISRHARGLGIHTVAINPNIHPDHPKDAPREMVNHIQEFGIDFPYLVDEAQATAKAFQAQCIPDIFLYDQNAKLVYHGRIDDSWQDERKVFRPELKMAVDALASGQEVERRQISSVGSSIQWR